MKLRLFEVVTDKDKIDIEVVKTMMDNKESIKDYAYILHDTDETRPHYHIAVRLRDSYDTKYIAVWFDVAENFICKVKGRWSDMLKYLIHENAPEKHQYSEENVVSNFDWKVEKNKGNDNKRKEEIINAIVDGNIREYNYTDTVSAIENDKWRRSIDNAFRYRTDKRKGVTREMDAIFITGSSGFGKTTYAKQLADEKKYSTYISSGSNDILDDYKGQDCIILDDLRPSSLGLADLLKMLDNHTSSTVKSRYKNKVLECKLIIITTVLDIDTFFKNVFAEELETSIQLKRRCGTHIRLEREYIYIKSWLNKSNVYGQEFKIPNMVTLKYKVEDMSQEEQLNKISELLGVSKDMIDYAKNNYDELKPIDNIENPFDR